MENEIYDIKTGQKKEPKKREQKTDLIIKRDDLFLYNRIKNILELNIEPLLFKFQEFQAGFSIVLLQVFKNDINIYRHLEKSKRDSDFLIKIFEDKNSFLLICQDTESEGAVHFSNRLINNIIYAINPFGEEKKKILSISVVSIENRFIGVKQLSYEIIKHFIKMKNSDKIWVQIKRF